MIFSIEDRATLADRDAKRAAAEHEVRVREAKNALRIEHADL
jgi:hypothetical protein